MRLYLIRHAHAGARLPGRSDFERPLDERGRERAANLAVELGDVGITAVLSSPATRCRETVEPLAARLGLAVVEQPDLWEGSDVGHVLALLTNQDGPAVAACSHGDVIPAVVEAIARSGASVQGRGCGKGSVWSLDHDGSTWTAASYLGTGG